jgi:hypothetical protein
MGNPSLYVFYLLQKKETCDTTNIATNIATNIHFG